MNNFFSQKELFLQDESSIPESVTALTGLGITLRNHATRFVLFTLYLKIVFMYNKFVNTYQLCPLFIMISMEILYAWLSEAKENIMIDICTVLSRILI